VCLLKSSTVNELLTILEAEEALYRDLKKISDKKTDIIVKGKVTELENLVKLEQSLVLQLGKLEDKREELVSFISEKLNINSSDLSISRLMEYAEENQVDTFKSIQEKMKSTIYSLKAVNQLNSNLIRNSLEYIDFSINLVTAAAATDNNYGNSGQVNNPDKRSFFDARL
jgi:hypothetical protein